MAFIFKSKTTGDLIMLDEAAKNILDVIGKEPSQTGIITVEQLDDAIEQLQAAVQREEEIQNSGHSTSGRHEEAQNLWSNSHISLKQRAWPFLEMLKKCKAAQVDVVWGV